MLLQKGSLDFKRFIANDERNNDYENTTDFL